MSADEVRQLGEEQTVEFKESLSSRTDAMQNLCAMVNTDAAYGSVIFGVADNGDIKGIEEENLNSRQQSLNQHIRDKFRPEIIRGIELLECEGKTLIRVNVQRALDVPLHEYAGRVWIKEGSDKRYLTFEEQMHYRRNRNRDYHNGPWRCSYCGTVVSTLGTSDQYGNRFYDCYRCNAGEYWPA
jgi:ATP-dependent DNA helicase RecG